MSNLSPESYGKNIAWWEVSMLTEAQRKWISRANDTGQIRYVGKGLGRAAWAKAMRALAAIGFVREQGRVFELTGLGFEYKRGADAITRVFRQLGQPKARTRWDDTLVPLLSDELGPNVPHPNIVVQGAKERWADLVARRFVVTDAGGYWSGS